MSTITVVLFITVVLLIVLFIQDRFVIKQLKETNEHQAERIADLRAELKKVRFELSQSKNAEDAVKETIDVIGGKGNQRIYDIDRVSNTNTTKIYEKRSNSEPYDSNTPTVTFDIDANDTYEININKPHHETTTTNHNSSYHNSYSNDYSSSSSSSYDSGSSYSSSDSSSSSSSSDSGGGWSD